MAHHAVGDEVAGPRRDVVHRDLDPQRLDRLDAQPTLELQCPPIDGALARDRRVNRLEEANVRGHSSAHADTQKPVRRAARLDYRLEAQTTETPDGPVDDRRIGVRNPDAVPEAAL